MHLRSKNSYLKFPPKNFGVHPVFPKLSVRDSVWCLTCVFGLVLVGGILTFVFLVRDRSGHKWCYMCPGTWHWGVSHFLWGLLLLFQSPKGMSGSEGMVEVVEVEVLARQCYPGTVGLLRQLADFFFRIQKKFYQSFVHIVWAYTQSFSSIAFELSEL